MSDDERNLNGLSDAERELANRLSELGPVMREQELAEAEMNQAFAHDLRSRLEHAPAARPVRRAVRRRLIGIRTALVTLAAIAVGLLLYLLSPRTPSFTAPYPTRADLIFNLPSPPSAVVRRLSPLVSLVHPRPGIPFAGHLRLTAPHLPPASPRLRAYRLAPPSDVVTMGRLLLHIKSPARRVARAGAEIWIVAADGGFPSHRPLHSLAVSLASGELIYHDQRNHALRHARKPVPRFFAVRAARRWLTRLGWPGAHMPLEAVKAVPGKPKVREVDFGWVGVGRTTINAATLWVTPDRSIIEAWVWPPVKKAGVIPTRSIAAAWTDVSAGHVPLVVEGVAATNRGSGAGTVRHADVVSVLTFGARKRLYLVPAYRFEGKAHISGASIHVWLSLAPSATK